MTIVSPAFSDETIPTAIHVHSDRSSGGKSVVEIAGIAKQQKVEAVIFTDLYHERYEFGFWIFKKVVERNSIMKTGATDYLQQIEKAAALHPEVLIMDGAAVTPFYFWSGHLIPGPLVLKNRAKDLLVLGLGDTQKYEQLSVVQNGRLGFKPYGKDPFLAPYQKFIDETTKMGGLVFWSHPHAHENVRFNNVVLGLDIVLHTQPYVEDLLHTKHYTGFGVFSSELAQINSPQVETTVSADGIWDRVLRQHSRGQRDHPVWALGEVDFSGLQKGINDLDGILNMIVVPKKSRDHLLRSLAEGKIYITIPSSHDKRLLLEDYAVLDMTSGQKVQWGGTLKAAGVPTVRLNAKFSDDSEGTMQFLLLRNGFVIQQWTKTVPFTFDFQDWDNTAPGKSYYRIIGYSEQSPDRLLTNPIFVERK